MIPSRLLGPRILRVPFATVLLISAVLGASTAWAEGQPPGPVPAPRLSEPERIRKLAERDRYQQEAIRHAQANKVEESITAFGKKLAIEREVLGELHEDVVGSLVILARLHELNEDWAAARKALAEVLAIRQPQPDQKDWRNADARRTLADLERRAGLDPAQRQRLQEANALNRLVGRLFSQGKYAEGIDPCRNAMEIRKRVLSENHPDYAESLSNLAVLYQAMGDHAKAEPLCHQALEITKRALGENHPDYAQSLNNLASLYWALGDYAKAEPLYRNALEIWKLALGENHCDYAQSLNNLAMVYLAIGDYAKAEPLFRNALEIWKRTLGEDHPDYAQA